MMWRVPAFFGPVIAAVLLVGLFITDSMHMTPADVGDYHQRVREAAEAFPWVVGDWVGKEVPVPTQATDMLQPNALISRRYENLRTGQTVSLLFIQTADAKLLRGHYPRECYPRAGWDLTNNQPVMLPADQGSSTQVRVDLYRFERMQFLRRQRLQVLNLMILPTKGYEIGMAGISRASGDYRVRHFGAATVQVVSHGGMTEAERKRIWAEFFEALQPVIRTIRSAEAMSTPRQ